MSKLIPMAGPASLPSQPEEAPGFPSDDEHADYHVIGTGIAVGLAGAVAGIAASVGMFLLALRAGGPATPGPFTTIGEPEPTRASLVIPAGFAAMVGTIAIMVRREFSKPVDRRTAGLVALAFALSAPLSYALLRSLVN